MNKTTHTPGPWRVNANVGKRGELGIVADAAPCVIAHGMSEKHWPEIAHANVQLIAAAPDLLAALESLYNAAPCAKPANSDLWEALQLTRQAIAKAKGEQ